MALEDKVAYNKLKDEVEQARKAAIIVIPHLRINPLLSAYLGVSKYLSYDDNDYMTNWDCTMQKKLEKLEDYMHCAHIDTIEEYNGHDSHKDYYQEKCKKCGKIIKEWSI